MTAAVPEQVSRRAAGALAAATLALGVVVGAAAAPVAPTTFHIQAGTPNDRVLVIADLPASSAAPAVTVVPTATPTATPTRTAAPGQSVIQVGPTDSAATILAAFGNLADDVVELRAGTYKTGSMSVNVDRHTRPLIVRPAAGAAVIFDGSLGGGQFYFGLGGAASDMDFEFAGVTFENYSLGSTGVVWMGNAKRITFNGPLVRKVTSSAGAINSWALYLSIDNGVSPDDVTADNWTVQGTSRNVSALQVGHPPSVMNRIKARGWSVSSVSIALYAYGTVNGLNVDTWTITDSQRSDRPGTVFFGPQVTGTFSNMHSDLGNLEAIGGMTRGVGNVGI